MKVFANREIRNLFQAVLAVWAVALALTQGIVWHRRMYFLSGYYWSFCFWAAVSGACFFAISKDRAHFWNRQSSKSKAVWMATRMHDWAATGRENFTVCFTPLMHWRQF